MSPSLLPISELANKQQNDNSENRTQESDIATKQNLCDINNNRSVCKIIIL